MTRRLYFTIDGLPVPMQRVTPFGANNFSGKPFTPRHTREAMKRVKTLVQQMMDGAPPMEGPVRLTVEAIFETPPSWPKYAQGATRHTHKPDAKNLVWLIEDALNKVAYYDDGQISELRCVKRYGSPTRTIVTIEQLPDRGSYSATKVRMRNFASSPCLPLDGGVARPRTVRKAKAAR